MLLLQAIGAKHSGAHLPAANLQEAKPYRNDPDVVAMTSLVDAYQRNNINEFEKTLKINRYMLGLVWHLCKTRTHAASGTHGDSTILCKPPCVAPCRQTIMADSFISQYIEDLLKNIRMQVRFLQVYQMHPPEALQQLLPF